MELTEYQVESKTIFEGKIVKLTLDQARLPNGSLASREVVYHPGGVAVLALDEDNTVTLVRQYRYPIRRELVELPAGKLEKGEDPFEAMKREQREETGTTAESYISLGEVYPTPGYCGEIIRLWACRAATQGAALQLDEDEFLATERIPLDKAVQMVLNNEIPDGKTQIGILKTAKLVEQGIL